MVGSHGSGNEGAMAGVSGSWGGCDDSVRREKVSRRKRAVNYTSGKTIFAV